MTAFTPEQEARRIIVEPLQFIPNHSFHARNHSAAPHTEKSGFSECAKSTH